MQTDIRRFGGYLSAILHPKNLKKPLLTYEKISCNYFVPFNSGYKSCYRSKNRIGVFENCAR